MLSVKKKKIYSILYCSSYSEKTIKYSIGNLTKLTIGKDSGCTISYNDTLMAPEHASIYILNGKWYIESSELEWARVYVNDIRVDKQELKTGDIIFIDGIKIIWMTSFFLINNPNETLTINGLFQMNDSTIDNSDYNEMSEEEELVPLYSAEEYFTHVPRLKTAYNNEEVIIDEPPASRLSEEQSILSTVGTTLVLLASVATMSIAFINNISNGNTSSLSLFAQGFTIVAMLISSLFVPRYLERKKHQKEKEQEKKRQEKYLAYLGEKESKINALMRSEIQILNENYPVSSECVSIINNKTRRLWEKEIKDDDFLCLRLGTGRRKASVQVSAPVEKFTLEDDNLKQQVFNVVNNSKYIDNVPITFSFSEKTASSIIFENNYNKEFMDSLILQLVTFHSPIDLKIVVLTNGEKNSRWEYIKTIPHIWTNDRSLRLYGEDLEEMKNISTYLEKEFSRRKEELSNNYNKDIDKKAGYRNFAPYYLIITDDYYSTRNVQFIKNFFDEKENLGFSLLLIDDSMRNVPNDCETFIDVTEKSCCIFEKELSSSTQTNFNPELVTVDMSDVCFKLANIPVQTDDATSQLPTSISFLEMYNVGNISQLNILNRWRTHNPVITLEAPIGLHPSGELFKLNLHEKFHGPHGLIAGMTGSGKSEFIITYILSMSINYHPDDVQFVLIDYKGGGLAGAFENRETGIKIPHLAGTITNLDTSEMNRTLVSIESELKRRQAKFNEARDRLDVSTIDIYKYQKYYHEGLIEEPISHLFIISDEFAELKSQQPTFMDQLISTARIGRSLGVHLILATQKPSGVVNDQIWSNTRFRVCLKVQDKSDSQEMLRRPEAASIKDTGRFYLQVGYDELFELGQSAWCGAKYTPTERIKKKQDDSITFVNNVGYAIKTVNDVHKKEDTTNYGDQLTNIVKHLGDIANRINYKPKQLWLDKIPNEIFLEDIKKKYKFQTKPGVLEAVVGEYDDPPKQSQGIVTVDFTNNGNLAVYGLPTTGKENLLSTIIYSLATDYDTDELNLYIMDFGAETLRIFNRFPQVGDIVYIEDKEKIVKLFKKIDNEIERRKELFADYSGNYMSYINETGNKLSRILIVLNAYENFIETYDNFEESLNIFVREGNRYGIYFIISTSVVNSIRLRMAQNFPNRLTMQLSDVYDYRTLAGAPKDLLPSKAFGRGIAKIDGVGYEFQTAFIANRDNISEEVKNAAVNLRMKAKSFAPPIPILPKKVLYNMLPTKNNLAAVPIGMYKEDISPVYYDFKRDIFNIVGCNIIDDKVSFVYALLKQLKTVANLKIEVFDGYGLLNRPMDGVEIYNDNFDEAFTKAYKELVKEHNRETDTLYLFFGFVKFKGELSRENQETFNAIFNSLKEFKHSYFIAMDNIQQFRNIELDYWYRNYVANTNGIWLGEGFASQSIIKTSDLSLEQRKVTYNEIGFYINHGKFYFIKHMLDIEGGNSNE